MARTLPEDDGENAQVQQDIEPQKTAEELIFAAMGGNNQGKKPKPWERPKEDTGFRVHY